jgi:hypothetical protein
MVAKLDYNKIAWENFLYYDEASPSYLRWKTDNGAWGISKRSAGEMADIRYLEDFTALVHL